MKKFVAVMLAGTMALSLVACGGNAAGTQQSEPSAQVEESVNDQESTEAVESAQESTEESAQESTEEASEESEEESEQAFGDVMTYAEYAEAELDSPVVIEAYVQANQAWWDGTVNVYAQDEDGAYFIYKLACATEDDAKKLVPGTKIRVKGYKAEFSGEVEIQDGTYEIVEGDAAFVAKPLDVTDLLSSDEIIEKQNQFVSFKGMKVEKEATYKWDGSGTQGDDLYFDVSVNGNTYTFTVESYLCGADTEVYKAVEALKAGDVVDMEGFLYWYEGVNPHITAVTVK